MAFIKCQRMFLWKKYRRLVCKYFMDTSNKYVFIKYTCSDHESSYLCRMCQMIACRENANKGITYRRHSLPPSLVIAYWLRIFLFLFENGKRIVQPLTDCELGVYKCLYISWLICCAMFSWISLPRKIPDVGDSKKWLRKYFQEKIIWGLDSKEFQARGPTEFYDLILDW